MLALVCGLAGACLALDSMAADPAAPVLRHGIWKLKKSVNQRPYESRECMQPFEELVRRHVGTADSGCTHEVTRQNETEWRISARCRKVNSEGRRWESDSVSVMTVTSETAYRLEVTGTANGVALRESVAGHWTGPCPQGAQ